MSNRGRIRGFECGERKLIPGRVAISGSELDNELHPLTYDVADHYTLVSGLDIHPWSRCAKYPTLPSYYAKATSLVSHSTAKIGYSRSSISSVMTGGRVSKKREKNSMEFFFRQYREEGRGRTRVTRSCPWGWNLRTMFTRTTRQSWWPRHLAKFSLANHRTCPSKCSTTTTTRSRNTAD